MSTLAGDAQEWESVGQLLADLQAGLLADLDVAHNRIAGQLPNLWQGPAAEQFSSAWQSQHTKLQQLTDLLGEAGSAVRSYGSALAQAQRGSAIARAEAEAGGLLVSGSRVALPMMAPTLPPAAQQQLAEIATRAERALWTAQQTADDAVQALNSTLRPIVGLLEEWGTARFAADIAAAGGAIGTAVLRWVKQHGVAELLSESPEHLMKLGVRVAKQRASVLSRELRAGSSEAARLLPQAGREARNFRTADKLMGPALTAIGTGFDIYAVYAEHRAGESWGQALGDNVQPLVTDAASVAIDAAILAGVASGVAVGGPTIALGVAILAVPVAVGYGVDQVWVHREKLGSLEMEGLDAAGGAVSTGIKKAEDFAGDAGHGLSSALSGTGHFVENLWHSAL